MALKTSKRSRSTMKTHSIKLTAEQEVGLNELAKARKQSGVPEPSIGLLIREAIDDMLRNPASDPGCVEQT
jgi:hypothetical protein